MERQKEGNSVQGEVALRPPRVSGERLDSRHRAWQRKPEVTPGDKQSSRNVPSLDDQASVAKAKAEVW